jgi:DNA-directed RNA polymerase subunit RPC12/RpoP
MKSIATMQESPADRRRAQIEQPQQCMRCGRPADSNATLAERYVYLRCPECAEVWSIRDRRSEPRT